MRINSIQPTLVKTNYAQRNNTKTQKFSNSSSVQKQNPSFKGPLGLRIGIGSGAISSLLVLTSAVLTGGASIPLIAATAAIATATAAGGFVGDKLEDKIRDLK